MGGASQNTDLHWRVLARAWMVPAADRFPHHHHRMGVGLRRLDTVDVPACRRQRPAADLHRGRLVLAMAIYGVHPLLHRDHPNPLDLSLDRAVVHLAIGDGCVSVWGVAPGRMVL